MSKFFAFLVVFFLLVGVGSVCVGQLVSDTSIISLSGKDWSLKVDGVLQSSLDSRNVPYMTSKSISEKELFLRLESFEDCKSGVVQFKVDMQGLTSFKQLPLDLELNIKEYSFVNSTHAINNSKVVVYRPENIVNSFALFDDSGRKQVHISASKLVDAGGSVVWCDSNLEGGLFTVVLPLEWLEVAKFPVVVDPTFGYITVGSSWQDLDGNTYANTYLGSVGDLTQISAYCKVASTEKTVYLGLYEDTLSLPSNRLVVGNQSVISTDGLWVNVSVSYTLDSVDYWLSASSLAGLSIAYDSGVVACLSWSVNVNPFVVDYNATNTKMSIYAVYGVTPTPTPSPSPSPSPSPTSLGTFTLVLGEGDWVLVLEVVMLIACFVSFVWLGKVPIVSLLVGLFAFLISLYCGLSGLWTGSNVIGYFGSFVALVGGVEMLLVGLGVRVRR